MPSTTNALILPVLLGLAACGGPELELGQHQAAILGGTDSQHPGVGLLLHDDTNPEDDRLCSATLIAPRFVLTAAHCVTTQTQPPFQTLELYFFVGAGTHLDPSTGFAGGEVYEVRSAEIYPTFAGGGASDLAVVELDSEVPSWVAEPVPIATWTPAVDEAVTLVGFGIETLGDTDTAGTQRETSALVTHRSSTSFRTEGKTCHGDSGGPALVGGEIVGVHSGVMDSACSSAVEMRVDVYRDWITGIVNGETETAPVGGQYGETCEDAYDCETLVCVTVSTWYSSYSACSMRCDPADPDCPDGDRCDGDSEVCVPDRGGKSDQVRVDRVQTDQAAGGCSMAASSRTRAGQGGLLLLLLGLVLALRRRGISHP